MTSQKLQSIFLAVSLVGNIAFPLLAFAQASPPAVDLDFAAFLRLIAQVISWFFTFLLVLSVGVVLYAGFTLLTSGGEPQKIESGKKLLLWAIVGFSVAILSRGIITLVCSQLIAGGCPLDVLSKINLTG